jgi:uncharacterized membrane protein YgcG
MTGRFFAVLGAVGAFVASCSVYDSSLLVDAPAAGGGANAGGGHGGKASSGGAATCDPLTWPPKPTSVLPSEQDLDGVFVMSTIDLGDSAAGANLSVGFDLDHLCTPNDDTKKTGQTCVIPSYGVGVPDGPRGQDNALGVTLQDIRKNRISEFNSENYTKGLQAGTADNVIFHVEGYNGLPDDDQVQVEALVSAPFDTYNVANTRPEWKGDDVWPIASDSYDSKTGNANYVDPNAYVAGGRLVVTLSKVTLRFVVTLASHPPIQLDLNLKGAVTVCDVQADESSRWKFTVKKCTLAARWLADDIVHQLSRFPEPLFKTGTTPLCTDTSSYPGFKIGVCSVIDVASDGLATPTAPCDALSLGIDFDTEPGNIGKKFDIVPLPDPCPAARSPKNDCCDCATPGAGGSASGGGGAGGKGGSSGNGGASGSTGAGDAGGSGGTTTDGGEDDSGAARDASAD